MSSRYCSRLVPVAAAALLPLLASTVLAHGDHGHEVPEGETITKEPIVRYTYLPGLLLSS